MFHYFCLADLTLVLKTGSRELYVFMAQEHGQLLAGYWYCWLVTGTAGWSPDHRWSTANCWLPTGTIDQGGVRSCST